MTKKGSLFRHIIFWLIFICYELMFIHFTTKSWGRFSHFVIFYTLNILLFYVNAHVLLDFAFFKTTKPYLVSFVLTLAELSVYLILKYLIDGWIATAGHPVSLNNLYAVTNTWRGLYFIGLSIAYWSMLYMVRFKERNHQMETEQLKTITKSLELKNKYMSVENAYLQNQISPHLLFNSLSFIYNTVYKESAEAGDCVARLAELMRYSLVSADDSRTVTLQKEVQQLQNLVELCRMRFRGEFYLRFKKRGRLAEAKIIPLVLITLVENMMKHGDLSEKRNPALIDLQLTGDRLCFETRNRKRNTDLYPKGGLGLRNIEKRLNNHYQDQYELNIRNLNDLFILTLTIKL